MGNRNGTVRQRMVGRRLRRLREQAGHTLEEAAAALEISGSRLARIETAQQGVDVHVVKSMLDLVRDARQKAWWRRYGLGDSSYVVFEADAALVQEYATGFVPDCFSCPTTPVPSSMRQRWHALTSSAKPRWSCDSSANVG